MKKLRDKLISVGLASSEFQEILKTASEEIVREAKSAPNEATIEGVFERVLYSALKEINVNFHPQKEITVDYIRHTGKGRLDSRIG